jgi:hypothetical protein
MGILDSLSDFPTIKDYWNEHNARQDSETAYKRTRELDQWLGSNQVQWRVGDLSKAGINPILAAGAGFGGGMSTQMSPQTQTQAATGMASNVQAQASRTAAEAQKVSSAAQAQTADANARTADAIIAKTEFEKFKLAQETDESWSRTNLNRVTAPLINQQVLTSAAQASNLDQDTKTKFAQEGLAMMQAVAAGINIGLTQAEIRRVNAQIKNIEADTGLKVENITATRLDNEQMAATMGIRQLMQGDSYKLLHSGVPAAENLSKMHESGFGRNVVPYLGSAEQISNIIGNVLGSAQRVRGMGGGPTSRPIGFTAEY